MNFQNNLILIIYSLVSNLYNLDLGMFQVLKGLDWAHRRILKEFECSAFMKYIESVSCLAGASHLKCHKTKGVSQ